MMNPFDRKGAWSMIPGGECIASTSARFNESASMTRRRAGSA